jgi:Spy/CpxP family protein refolding chaperone
MTISPFLIPGAMLVAAVLTVAFYNVSAANAQSSNMTKTKTMTGPNMTKTANMTAGGHNMTTFSAEELRAYSQCLRSSCDLF